MSCRICGQATRVILDLGDAPCANTFVSRADEPLKSYPLTLELCEACGNLQLRECMDPQDLYRDYAYATPDASTLRRHYAALHAFLSANGYLSADSFVLEVGSNVGAWLGHIKPHTRKTLGLDPAVNICRLANAAGIETLCAFFDHASAAEVRVAHGRPDTIVARHCFAHNPDPHVLVGAAAGLLAGEGVLVIENAYALDTIENNEFDQVLHEHMFYFSARPMQALLERHGLRLVNCMTAGIHGGSIVFVAAKADGRVPVQASVAERLEEERRRLTNAAFERFAENARAICAELRTRLRDLARSGSTVYAYGATAKGNTLINWAGLTREQVKFCVDNTPIKQGKYLPGSGIPVITEEQALASPPDYFLLTAWNYRDEIIAKVRNAGNRHARFIIPVPHVHVV